MNSAFKDYFKENFFQDEKELEVFLSSLHKHLTKTIRINWNKATVEEEIKSLEAKSYELEPTFQPNVFYAKRKEDSGELERRLGFTLDHLLGKFYIQEL